VTEKARTLRCFRSNGLMISIPTTVCGSIWTTYAAGQITGTWETRQ
jgi:hypothetical protein